MVVIFCKRYCHAPSFFVLFFPFYGQSSAFFASSSVKRFYFAGKRLFPPSSPTFVSKFSPRIFHQNFLFPHLPQGFQHLLHKSLVSRTSLYSIFTLHVPFLLSKFCVILFPYLSPPLPRFCLPFSHFSGFYRDLFLVCDQIHTKDRRSKMTHRSPVLAKCVFTLWAVPSAPAPAGRGRKWPCVRSGCLPGAG